MTERLNHYQGHAKIFPQALTGGYTAYYRITMEDGKIHEVSVAGQNRLSIDKIVYEGDTEMLGQWLERTVEKVDSLSVTSQNSSDPYSLYAVSALPFGYGSTSSSIREISPAFTVCAQCSGFQYLINSWQ